GFDLRGIARAAFSFLRLKGLQGGSTLTQQLVKNFFLTPERTLSRKVTELFMAVLLEIHYDKDEILETYLNEIYLGQDRDRAIHGVGLASLFYFGKTVEHLTLAESALLVGMVKGPTFYDPFRNPERALERRNLVLRETKDRGFATMEQYAQARAADLGVNQKAAMGTSPHPAFLDLVHRQLRRDYDEADLRSEGLRVFTTLAPGPISASRKSSPRSNDSASSAKCSLSLRRCSARWTSPRWKWRRCTRPSRAGDSARPCAPSAKSRLRTVARSNAMRSR